MCLSCRRLQPITLNFYTIKNIQLNSIGDDNTEYETQIHQFLGPFEFSHLINISIGPENNQDAW